jgi:hypothetical protein
MITVELAGLGSVGISYIHAFGNPKTRTAGGIAQMHTLAWGEMSGVASSVLVPMEKQPGYGAATVRLDAPILLQRARGLRRGRFLTGSHQADAICYVGTVINPQIVEEQVQSVVVQGISYCLFEQFVYDENSQQLTSTFKNYKLATAADVPSVEVHHEVGTPCPHTPLGSRGLGEGIPDAISGALTNAVAMRCGRSVSRLTNCRSVLIRRPPNEL